MNAVRLAPPLEYQECIALNNFRLTMLNQEPRLEWLLHIPNGELRDKRIAAKLKAMGVLAGVVDYFLPVPLVSSEGVLMRAGLWLELKRSGLQTWAAKLRACSPDQQDFLGAMQARGYAIAIASGWIEGAQALCRYLERPDLMP
jgi:phosphoserine phosphatase